MTPCPKPAPREKRPRKELNRTPWKRERPTDGRWSSLQSSGAPQRKARIKVRGRKGHRFPHLVIEPFREWIREQPCCITGLRTGAWIKTPTGWVRIHVDPAHVKRRGAGGADANNICPLARHLHQEYDDRGRKSFEQKYGVDMAAKAVDYWSRFCAETGWPVDQERVA